MATQEDYTNRIIGARVALLIAAPFFGNLALRLKLVDATAWCKTAATDGRNFFYNRDFLDKLNKGQLVFLVAHEVLHCVYAHMFRCGGRDPKLFNVAADYVINGEIAEHLVNKKIAEMITKSTVGFDVCYDEKYNGLCTEEVYALLEKNTKVKYQTLDEHLDGCAGSEDSTGGSSCNVPSEYRYSKEQQEAIKDEIKQAVMQAGQAAGSSGLPGGVARLLATIAVPLMNWRELITADIKSVIKDDYTWTKRSRKCHSSPYYLPSLKNDMYIELCISIDTSGSMSDAMLRDLLSEVVGITSMFKDYLIKLWCFDTSVHAYAEFTPDNIIDIDDYKMAGGGGTDFECNWRFMQKHGITPQKFLMFTDGLTNTTFGDENYCDTLFLIHSDPGRRIIAPFGQTVHYEENI